MKNDEMGRLVMELQDEKRQWEAAKRYKRAFWLGVKAGVLWVSGISIGGVAFIYYVLEIIDRFH